MCGEGFTGRGEGRGLAGTGRTLHHDESGVAGQRCGRGPLPRVQAIHHSRLDWGHSSGAARGEPGDAGLLPRRGRAER